MEQHTVDGITAYLVSLAAYGCGEVTCRRIAEHYGDATRARRLCIIVGSRQALERAVRTADSSIRNTRLRERMEE